MEAELAALDTAGAEGEWLRDFLLDLPVVEKPIPAIFMTFICSSYIFISPLMFGMQNRVLGLILGAVLTLIIMIMFIYKIRMDNKSRNLTLRAGMTIALKNAREAYVMK